MHAELNRAPYNEQSHIRHHVQHRIDLFNRDRHKFTWLNFANKRLRALTEYPLRFRPLFLPCKTASEK